MLQVKSVVLDGRGPTPMGGPWPLSPRLESHQVGPFTFEVRPGELTGLVGEGACHLLNGLQGYGALERGRLIWFDGTVYPLGSQTGGGVVGGRRGRRQGPGRQSPPGAAGNGVLPHMGAVSPYSLHPARLRVAELLRLELMLPLLRGGVAQPAGATTTDQVAPLVDQMGGLLTGNGSSQSGRLPGAGTRIRRLSPQAREALALLCGICASPPVVLVNRYQGVSVPGSPIEGVVDRWLELLKDRGMALVWAAPCESFLPGGLDTTVHLHRSEEDPRSGARPLHDQQGREPQ